MFYHLICFIYMTEDKMAEQQHTCNGHELGQTLWDAERQGGLACCSPWCHKSWTWLGDWKTIVYIKNYQKVLMNKLKMIRDFNIKWKKAWKL